MSGKSTNYTHPFSNGRGAESLTQINCESSRPYQFGVRFGLEADICDDWTLGQSRRRLRTVSRVYPSLWVSPRADGRLGARLSPRSLLHRLLLGLDGALVCRRCHESLLDRCPCGIGAGRKGGAWSACAANCRDCFCSERGLVADPGCLIQCPLLAQSRQCRYWG